MNKKLDEQIKESWNNLKWHDYEYLDFEKVIKDLIKSQPRKELFEYARKLQAMLLRIQWSKYNQETAINYCPICYKDQDDGHEINCELSALLPKDKKDD